MTKKKKPNKEQENKKHLSGHNSLQLNSPDKFENKRILFLLFIVIVVFVCYSPVLKNDFVNFDDHAVLIDNPVVINGHGEDAFKALSFSPNYKPLVFLSWIAEYKYFGSEPFHFHLDNLLLHLLNCILIFFIALKLSRYLPINKNEKILTAFFVALLFGVHPIHVESVAWAVERKDVLFSFFYLSGILFYLIYLERPGKYIWLIATLLAYIFALFSKSMAISFPAVIFIIDYLAKRKLNKKIIFEKIPFLIILIGSGILYGLIGNFNNSSDIVNVNEMVFSSANTIKEVPLLKGLPVFYQKTLIISFRIIYWPLHTLLPFKLAVEYPRDNFIETTGKLIYAIPVFILFIIWLMIKYRNSHRWLIWSLLFVLIGLSPALLISDKGASTFVSDRYTYISSIGIIFIIVVSLMKFLGNKYLKITALSLLVIIMGVNCYSRCKVWKDSETLWTDVIKKYPQASLAYSNRGKFYTENNKAELALADYNQAIKLNTQNADVFSNRGHIYFDREKDSLALADYNKALQLNKNHVTALSNRGALFSREKKYDLALADFSRALEINPDYKIAIKNRAFVYIYLKQYENAIHGFESYLKYEPADADSYNSIGVCYRNLSNYESSINAFNSAIRLDENPHYYLNRSLSWNDLRKLDEARNDAQKAQKLGLNIPESYLKKLGL